MKNEPGIKLSCIACEKELSKEARKAKKLNGTIYCKECSGLKGEMEFFLPCDPKVLPKMLCSHCGEKISRDETIKDLCIFDSKEEKYYCLKCITYDPKNNMVIL